MILGTKFARLVLLQLSIPYLGCALVAGFGDVPSSGPARDGGPEADDPEEGEATIEESAVCDFRDAGLAPTDCSQGAPVDSPVDEEEDASASGPARDSPLDPGGRLSANFPTMDAADQFAPQPPSTLSGLVLWLDGTAGLSYSDAGAESLTWQDRSGQHNNATSIGVPSIHANAIGGNPAVHFNGASDYLVVADGPSLQFSTGEFAIALVAAHKTPVAVGPWPYGLLYVKEITGTSPYFGIAISGNAVDTLAPRGSIWAQVAFRSDSYLQTSEASFNDGRPFCVSLHRVPVGMGVASLTLRVNGANVVTGTGVGDALDVSAVGYPVLIGGTAAQQDVLGDVAEVIAVKGFVSESNLRGVEAYLLRKYQL